MEVTLLETTGLNAACMSLYISKNHLDKFFEWRKDDVDGSEFDAMVDKMFKIGKKHSTILRFIDFTFLVQGMHRAGQDDWDSHAKRFDNRIIRLSTRYSHVEEGSMSAWYDGKIIPTDVMLEELDISVPQEVLIDGKNYVKTVNGYVAEEYAEDQDVLRGLYMLSLPSNFIFKINLAEFAHVYKMRNQYSGAHPEVKELCQKCYEYIKEVFPQVTADYLYMVEN